MKVKATDHPPSPDFAPLRMDEIELSVPLPDLRPGRTETGLLFAASLCLVLLHGRPIGLITVDLPDNGLTAADLARRIEDELGDRIRAHLTDDGLPVEAVSATGFEATGTPRCISEQARFLAGAPKVSVVICTRNRPDSVRSTLRSILACRYPVDRWEIVVVDNAAEADPSIASAAEEVDSPVPVRVVHEPLAGLSNARNCGVRSSTGEIVAFADDDVEVNREWLAVLTAPFAADERVGATSGITLPGALETPVQLWTEGFGGRSRPLDVRRFDIENPPPDRPLFPFTVGEFGAGRNMAFRRDLLERLGGFDPALGPGSLAHDGDDIEALLRVVLAHRVIVHDPGAVVWHAHPDDYEELEGRVWGYGLGLTACLTKAVIDHPSLLFDALRKLPRGIAFASSASSEKNRGRQPDFPRALARKELLGLLVGPFAYARSRRQARRRAHEVAPAKPEPERSLRILVVTDEYPPVVGGAARNIALLARRLVQAGHSVTVATSWQPNAPDVDDDHGVGIHRIRDLFSRFPGLSDDPHRHHPPPFADPEAVTRLRGLISSVAPDLVHAYGWMSASAAAALAGSSAPLVLSTHDYGNVCALFTLVRDGTACSGPAPAKCLACASSTYGSAKAAVAVGGILSSQPLLRHKVKAIHSVSGFTADVVDRQLRIPGARPVVIPNFLEPTEESEPDETVLADLPGEPFMLFIGHLRRYKGIEVLLAAYERMKDPPPLVTVGTLGADTPEHFPAGVTVHTYVSHPTVMAIWERSMFGVSPSIAPEALPSVVLEAMSVGKPMIGSDIGGYRDMIEPDGTGLLVPPGDPDALAAAMTLLAGDGELRRRLGERAAQSAGRFSPEAVVPAIERLYRQTLASAGTR